jgi:hypothetical protein
MANSIFVPATAFNCESREPEKWSFYLRRRLLGIGGSGWRNGGGLGSGWAGLWDSGSSEGEAAASAAGSGGGSGAAGEAAAAG